MAARKGLTIDDLKDEMKVTDEQLDSRVEETDLPELAACFDNTEDYVEKLGLSPAQQTDVETKTFVCGVQAGMKKALKYWRNKNPLTSTFRALILILLILTKGDIAVTVCKYMSIKYSLSRTQSGMLTNPGLLSYGDYLKSRYEVVSTSSVQWPPLPTRKVFKLAMIQKENIQRGKIDDDIILLSITGKVDDILQRKTPVQLENIFGNDTQGQRFVLIEGAPGSGKSTLALHICQEWTKGKLFKEYDVVVLVRLRDPHIRKAKTVADILPYADIAMTHETEAAMKPVYGRGVLWVLDGWDELPSDLPQDSIINKLITPEKSPLHKCALIVTSRPSSSAKLHPLVSSRVEVLGFTPIEMEQYFTECLKGNNQAVQTLLERIWENPVVEETCFLPLNASIIAHVFISGDHSLPTSNHEIFTSLVKFSLSRYMQDRLGMSSEQAMFTAYDDLHENVRDHVTELCKLAYYGVVENKATFVIEDFRTAGVSMKVCDLGLLQTVPSILVDGRKSYFNFLHLSIQELLAAIHISHMPGNDQMAVFKDLFGKPQFSAIMEFYAGITKLKTCCPFLSLLPNSFSSQPPLELQDLVSGIVRGKKEPQLVSLLRCLHEAEDPTLCQFVASLLDHQLRLWDVTLSPLDCLSIGYFLSWVCTSIDGGFFVDLGGCHIGDQGCKFLTRGLSKCLNFRSNVTSKLNLNLSNNGISNIGVEHIATLLKNTNAIWKLDLSNNEAIGDSGMARLSEALSINTTLEKLTLRWHNSCPSLCQLLSTTKSLTHLYLFHNPLPTCHHLAAGLSNNHTLKYLFLMYCSLTDQSVADLCTGLNNCIEVLYIYDNPSLTESGMKMLADCLTTLSSMRLLWIPSHLRRTIDTLFRDTNQARIRNRLPAIDVL